VVDVEAVVGKHAVDVGLLDDGSGGEAVLLRPQVAQRVHELRGIDVGLGVERRRPERVSLRIHRVGQVADGAVEVPPGRRDEVVGGARAGVAASVDDVGYRLDQVGARLVRGRALGQGGGAGRRKDDVGLDDVPGRVAVVSDRVPDVVVTGARIAKVLDEG
jgi:hypothetical protein